MKKLIVIIAFVLFINAAKAQSLDNAIKEIQKENLVKAKIELLKIYSASKNLDAAFYLGNVYLKDGVTDSAKYYYSIAETGSSALSSVAKARISLMNGGNDDAAKAIADKALSVSKRKDAEVLFQIGQLAYRPNPVNVAAYIDFVKEASTISENKYYTLVLGDMYLDLNQGGKAMSTYEDVTMIDSNHVLANIRVGRLYYAAKNNEMAIKYLERANRNDNSYSIVHKELGELYYINKNYDRASEEFKKYIELNYNDSKAKMTYSGFLFQLKEYQKTIDEVNGFYKADTTNGVYLKILAFSYQELKKSKQALTYLDKYLKYTPADKINGLDYTYAGKIYASNGDTTKAINAYKTAISKDSLNADVFSEFGKTLFNFKRYGDAVLILNKRVKMEKVASSLDYYYLGRAYYACKEYVNADTNFALFVQMQPKLADGYLWRANCQLRLDDTKNPKGLSSPFYTKFIEIASSDIVKNKSNLITAYNYLGFIALHNKDNASAKANFEKVLSIDPENTEAKEAIAKIK